MSGFEIVFDGDAGAPKAGGTVEFDGAVWDVVRVDDDEGTIRVHLVEGRAGGAAAQRPFAPVPLAVPTSFESELVFTLDDLSTRLSTLARALNAYWSPGARGAA